MDRRGWKQWVVTGLVVIALVVLGLTARWWLPGLLTSLGASGTEFGWVTDLVQLVLWGCAGIALVVGLWPPAALGGLAEEPEADSSAYDPSTALPGDEPQSSRRVILLPLASAILALVLVIGISAIAVALGRGEASSTEVTPTEVAAVGSTSAVPSLTAPAPTASPEEATGLPEPSATPRPSSEPTAVRTATPRSTQLVATKTPAPTEGPAGSTPLPTASPTLAATPTARPPAAPAGRIAYTVWSPVVGGYQLFIGGVDGSDHRLLGNGFRQPQFRRDGAVLAVNADGAGGLESLVVVNLGNGETVAVSTYIEDSFPTWSPDGTKIAFSSTAWGDGQVRLGAVDDLALKRQDWLRVGGREVVGKFPFWMADWRIVYNGCDFLDDVNACGLYWVVPASDQYEQLTTHTSDTAPAESQGRVAFMSERDGNWDIYRVDLAGGDVQQLTHDEAADGLPTWSPDGRWIAFVSSRGGSWAIWAMEADGGNARKLFDLNGTYGTGEYDWTRERISWGP